MPEEKHAGICYKKNFLDQVIVRLDLLNEIIDLQKNINKEFHSEIIKLFNIPEPRDGTSQDIRIVNNEVIHRTKTRKEWIFHGENKDKTLTVTSDSIFISYKDYNKYEELRNDFETILNSFFKQYKNAICKRLGLRYINDIRLNNEENPLDWKNYIKKDLIGLLEYSNYRENISRVFHNLAFNLKEYKLIFQFGVHNPDFPSPVKKKDFILDFDAYSDQSQEIPEIIASIDMYHERIQTIFEDSITDELREELNG